MRKTDGCKLFGAYQALAGIKDCIILFHSVVGCHFGTLGLHLNHCPVEIHQASTLMGNKEVIFGGAEAIRQALETVLRESKIRTICLISGCISELIEDDLDAICREYEERLRLIVIHAPGFEGGITEGYEDALLSLSCFLEPKLGTQKWDGRRINVFGLGTDDYCARGDWKQIQNLLGEQVILNPCPPFCSVEDVKGLAQADSTLGFGRGKKLAE